MAATGVRTVINLRTPAEMAGRDEPAEVQAAGMAYRELPIAGMESVTAANAAALAALIPCPCTKKDAAGAYTHEIRQSVYIHRAAPGDDAQNPTPFGSGGNGLHLAETTILHVFRSPRTFR